MQAQERTDRASWTTRLESDVVDGTLGITTWYDVPVSLVFLARSYYKADNPATKVLSLPPLAIDESIALQVGIAGQESPGSVDPWMLANGIAAARLLYAVSSNIAGDDHMKEEYAHLWTYYRALMYNHLLTELVKNTIRRQRPDATDTKSFFSAHTSTAFVTSAFLYRECAEVIDAWGLAGESELLTTGLKAAAFGVLYGWAGYVGYSRLADKKHYISDVLVGAVVGTLIGNLVYDEYFSPGNSEAFPRLSLGVIEQQPALSLSYTF